MLRSLLVPLQQMPHGVLGVINSCFSVPHNLLSGLFEQRFPGGQRAVAAIDNLRFPIKTRAG